MSKNVAIDGVSHYRRPTKETRFISITETEPLSPVITINLIIRWLTWLSSPSWIVAIASVTSWRSRLDPNFSSVYTLPHIYPSLSRFGRISSNNRMTDKSSDNDCLEELHLIPLLVGLSSGKYTKAVPAGNHLPRRKGMWRQLNTPSGCLDKTRYYWRSEAYEDCSGNSWLT